MKIPEGLYIFHLIQKGRMDKEIYVYFANKKEWDKTGEFPTDFGDSDREELEEFFEEAGLIKEEDGLYRLETPIFRKDLVSQLTDAGFEMQEDFSDFVDDLISGNSDQDDDDDSIDEDSSRLDDYIDNKQDRDSYLDRDE